MSGSVRKSCRPSDWARQLADLGAGEIVVQCIDREGTFRGYDIDLLQMIANAVDVPVVASGGAKGISDFVEAIKVGGCSAVAAGSIFVYHSKTRGVLINYPTQMELQQKLFDQL